MTYAEKEKWLRNVAIEALYCDSNSKACAINDRINAFVAENDCAELADAVFYETGAGDALGDMLDNFDDGVLPEDYTPPGFQL